jgi:hypothetical protein
LAAPCGGLVAARLGTSLDPRGTAQSDRFESFDLAVSTRTYIVLAALTGVVILVAFALQVVLVNK